MEELTKQDKRQLKARIESVLSIHVCKSAMERPAYKQINDTPDNLCA